MCKLTIITSLYRSETFLPTFIKRVKTVHDELQTSGVSFEHIVVANDPSIVEAELLSSTHNLTIINTPRESLYASWNRGVNSSRGQVVTFWNVDDIRFTKALIEGITLLEQYSTLVYFPFRYKRYILLGSLPVLVKSRIIQPPPFDTVEFGQSMHCGPFFMFSKNFYNTVGGFDETFRIAGDFEWCIRASKKGAFIKGQHIAGTFINQGTSLSGSRNSALAEENKKIYTTYHIHK